MVMRLGVCKQKRRSKAMDLSDILVACERLKIDFGKKTASINKAVDLVRIREELGTRARWAEDNLQSPVLWETMAEPVEEELQRLLKTF
jgi:hypothetical protein